MRQGLDGFRKSLHPCALDESSLNIGRFKLVPLSNIPHFNHVNVLAVSLKCKERPRKKPYFLIEINQLKYH